MEEVRQSDPLHLIKFSSTSVLNQKNSCSLNEKPGSVSQISLIIKAAQHRSQSWWIYFCAQEPEELEQNLHLTSFSLKRTGLWFEFFPNQDFSLCHLLAKNLIFLIIFFFSAKEHKFYLVLPGHLAIKNFMEQRRHNKVPHLPAQ